MMIKVKDNWFSALEESLSSFTKEAEEKMKQEMQQIKDMMKNVEQESQLAAEYKLKGELEAHMEELSRRSSELDKACLNFENLHITDSDQNRLDNAKETYQLAKELTGIRLDFSSPPNVAKGYIKSESRKLLQPFEVDFSSGGDSEALWNLILSTSAPGWPSSDKENCVYN